MDRYLQLRPVRFSPTQAIGIRDCGTDWEDPGGSMSSNGMMFEWQEVFAHNTDEIWPILGNLGRGINCVSHHAVELQLSTPTKRKNWRHVKESRFARVTSGQEPEARKGGLVQGARQKCLGQTVEDGRGGFDEEISIWWVGQGSEHRSLYSYRCESVKSTNLIDTKQTVDQEFYNGYVAFPNRLLINQSSP